MPTYVVTGGCGFIGSHLVEALRRDGHMVRVLDDLSTGHRHNLPADVPLVVGDIRDRDAVEGVLEGADGCFHLAAIASVERGVRDWPGTHTVNLSGTITILDVIRARSSPVPLVYASSAAVYGDCPALPLSETSAPTPLSAYGADKLGCEQHARVGHAVFGIPSVGLRFFNVYGPRQDPRSPYSGVISIFCDRLLRGAPATIYGDGEQTRDFIAVADVTAALLAAMAHAERVGGASVFNVCTGVAVSVRTLAETIARLAGIVPELRQGPPRAGEIRHSIGRPDKARDILGLSPARPLETGLTAVLDWLRASNAA